MGQPALPPGNVHDVVPLRARRKARMPRLSRTEWLHFVAALGLTVGGLAFIAMAAGWTLAARAAQRAWVTSPEGQAAAAVAAAPTPVWIPPGYVPLLSAAATTGDATETTASSAPIIVPGPPSSVQLISSGFVFLDPPEPGARARVTLDLQVTGGGGRATLSLAIATQWFDSYRLAASQPPARVQDQPDAGTRRLVFADLEPGRQTLQMDVIATHERVDAPVIRVFLEPNDILVGEAHPRTVAPKPRPGPVSALRIPRLNLRVAVVPTAWEPPAFVAGQIRSSANIMLGNTVLVGHLGGASGDVFKDLDQLQLGDNVIAVSRGLEYTFVVSQKEVRSGDDSGPTLPSDTPRMTLMTCAGTWDPLLHQYSDRVWVTAEPSDLAARTILANASRPPTPVPSPSPAANPTPDSALAAVNIGLGAERAQLDRALGPPLGETPGRLVVYRKGSVEYHVGFTPDPPRAQLISVAAVASGGTLSIPTAVEDAHAQFPTDAEPRTNAPDGSPNLVVERYSSPALAAALGDSGASGDFIAAYARDTSGAVTRVVVADGDDPAQALQDGAR